MVWVIFNVVFLALVAVLMILNGGNSSGFNFFGLFKSESVPAVVILIIGFICGVLYSFLMYAIRQFKKMNWEFFKRKKEKIKKKESDVKAKEKAVNEKEKQLDSNKKLLGEKESQPDSANQTDKKDEMPAKKKQAAAGKKKKS